MKKTIMTVLIFIFLSNITYAQNIFSQTGFAQTGFAQTGFTNADLQLPLYIPQSGAEFLTPMGYHAGSGFLNIILGLGSWMAGDEKGAIPITIVQAAGLICAIGFGSRDISSGEWTFLKAPLTRTGIGLAFGIGIGSLSVLFFKDIMVLPLVALGGSFIGYCTVFFDKNIHSSSKMAAASVAVWALGVFGGFLVPMLYQRNEAQAQSQTAKLNDARNWNFAFFPNESGRLTGYLAFTAHF